jgi:hypothetical protein
MATNLILSTLGIFSILLAMLIDQKIKFPLPEVSKQEIALNVKSQFIKLTSIGLKRVMSDLFWIQSLMESDLDHYKKKDLNSWLYLRFLTISELDPKFYENYYYGAQYLMVIKDDLSGSEDLLLRGLKPYPKDVGLNWQMGYLKAIEQGKPLEAIKFFDVIKFDPNRPKMFDSLYTKIASNTLGMKEAFDYAVMMLEERRDMKDDPIKERLQKQAYTLKAMIDLDCLNSKKSNCSVHDFFGNPYIKKEGQYTAPRELIPMNLKINNQRGSD